jgi:hypothetical protein
VLEFFFGLIIDIVDNFELNPRVSILMSSGVGLLTMGGVWYAAWRSEKRAVERSKNELETKLQQGGYELMDLEEEIERKEKLRENKNSPDRKDSLSLIKGLKRLKEWESWRGKDLKLSLGRAYNGFKYIKKNADSLDLDFMELDEIEEKLDELRDYREKNDL